MGCMSSTRALNVAMTSFFERRILKAAPTAGGGPPLTFSSRRTCVYSSERLFTFFFCLEKPPLPVKIT